MRLPPATAQVMVKRTRHGSVRYTFIMTGPAGSALLTVTDPPGFEARFGEMFHVDGELVRPGPTLAPELLLTFRRTPAPPAPQASAPKSNGTATAGA